MKTLDENNRQLLLRLPEIVLQESPGACDSTPTNPHVSEISQPDIRYLEHIRQHKFLNVTESAEVLQCSYKVLDAAIDRLCHMKLCESIEMRMNTKGRNSKYTYLTRAGLLVLGEPVARLRGGTELGHRFLQEHQCHLLSQRGIKAELEMSRNSSPQVDVGFLDSETGLWIAEEVVCTTEATEAEKARRILSSWDRLILVSATVPQRNHLHQQILNSGIQFADKHPVLCLPAHIRETKFLREIYDFPGLVFANSKTKQRKE